MSGEVILTSRQRRFDTWWSRLKWRVAASNSDSDIDLWKLSTVERSSFEFRDDRWVVLH